MLNPVNFTSAATTSSAPNAMHSTATPPLTNQLAGVSNAAPTGNIPFSRQSPPRLANPGARSGTEAKQRFRAFSDLYNTNAGAKAINTLMREGNAAFDIGGIMNEIERRSGPEEIASYKKNGIDIRSNVKSMADKAQLKLVADEIYQAADPAKLSRNPVHRGQGMTPAGIKHLIDLRKQGTPVKATHFLSCDKTLKVAKAFAEQHIQGEEKPVLFQIWGYSNVALRPHIAVAGESETLFTPNATFRIDNIGKSPATGNTVVHLTEIAPDRNAIPLPY